MKKKVYINGKFLGQPLTGVQRTAHELVNALDQLLDQGIVSNSDFDFILIHPRIDKILVQYKHIKLLSKGFLEGNLWEQFELPLYTRGHLLVSMCMVSTLFKRKQIVIVHDASVFVNPAFFSLSFRTWYKFAIRILGKSALHIITVSNFSKGELVEHAGISATKISVIYNAADHIKTYGNPNDTFKKKVSSLKPYLLAVSSLAKNKNFSALLEAFQQTDFKKYKVAIAGGVSNTLSSVSVGSSSNYLGYVSNAELKYLYENASLFIFPSFYEGFGIPPLEAMISGCPVIASNTSSLPEVLGDGCQYFNPLDVNSIKEKIEGVLGNPPELTLLREKGLEQAKKYSWTKSAISLFEIIKRFC